MKVLSACFWKWRYLPKTNIIQQRRFSNPRLFQICTSESDTSNSIHLSSTRTHYFFTQAQFIITLKALPIAQVQFTVFLMLIKVILTCTIITSTFKMLLKFSCHLSTISGRKISSPYVDYQLPDRREKLLQRLKIESEICIISFHVS